jgi:8-oxo-dGTP pyrophosphatase MutT (NUDIX family)
VSPEFPSTAILRAALHAPEAVPEGPGWNQAELADVLPAGSLLADAAVLVPLVRRDTLSVVLTRRTDSLRHHAGQVSFPGGRIDATDAGPVAAALREAHEEIGLRAAQAEVQGYLDPLATITGFRVVPVVAFVAPEFVAIPEPGEVASVFELPLAWLLDPRNLQRVEIDHQGRPRGVLEFRRHACAAEHRIWGATASILYNLRQRLAQAGRGGTP